MHLVLRTKAMHAHTHPWGPQPSHLRMRCSRMRPRLQSPSLQLRRQRQCQPLHRRHLQHRPGRHLQQRRPRQPPRLPRLPRPRPPRPPRPLPALPRQLRRCWRRLQRQSSWMGRVAALTTFPLMRPPCVQWRRRPQQPCPPRWICRMRLRLRRRRRLRRPRLQLMPPSLRWTHSGSQLAPCLLSSLRPHRRPQRLRPRLPRPAAPRQPRRR
mmetsp:Transcript_37870/g.112100  ORF Transcript_37870/g.112100 Transcript_37870/m.112100 type:complete len:211 (+) Transcript_37870:356-988(+)